MIESRRQQIIFISLYSPIKTTNICKYRTGYTNFTLKSWFFLLSCVFDFNRQKIKINSDVMSAFYTIM